ncbi:hypothetical protein GNIT_2042 [Glaciecola nitratireducens FR1064]|uniref:Uncharacterized protein n=1 Tax=Glaciecola nitratireducens (strain JCM 12485 / KCTC 12276 / FR1064) TaxID=1085623 RepID=G4QLP5_GLANF|nr:hypothetical protein GNIT_2042 [Glaciecola nitratireducens FR1064]
MLVYVNQVRWNQHFMIIKDGLNRIAVLDSLTLSIFSMDRVSEI